MLIKQLNPVLMTNLKVNAFSIVAFFLGTGLEKMTIIALAFLVLISLLSINKHTIFEAKEKKMFFFFLSFFFLIVLYSIVFSEYKYIERNISFVLFPLLCFYLNKEEVQNIKLTKKVCFSFSLGLIIYPLVIILIYFFLRIPTETGNPLEISSFYQLKRIVFSTNILNHTFHNVYYATYSICAIIFLYSLRKNFKMKIIIYSFISMHLFFILLAASRMSYILISLLILIFVIVGIIKKSKKILYIIPVLFMSIFFLVNKYSYLQYKFVKSFPSAINTRLIIWSNSYEIIKENLFGMGFRNFHNLLNIKNKQVSSEIAENLNSHNQYLEYFGALGVFGGLFFLLLLGYIAKIVIRDKNFVLMLFMLVMLVSFATESWFIRQYGIVFFMFFLCLLWQKRTIK